MGNLRILGTLVLAALATQVAAVDVVRADSVSTIPLAYIIQDASDAAFLNPRLRPTDIVAAKPDTMQLLDGITAGRKLLLIGPSHEKAPGVVWQAMKDDEMSALLAQARRHGVTMFGYNLENSFHGEALVERERHVAGLARAAGMDYVFGPLVGRLMERGGEAAAREADVVVVQAQLFQKSSGFEVQKVLEVVKRLRKANPKVRVHIQIMLRYRDNSDLMPVDKVIEHLGLIAADAEAVWLFSGPQSTARFREVFSRLRETVPISARPAGEKEPPPSLPRPAGSAAGTAPSPSRPPDRDLSSLPPVPRNARFTTGAWVPFARLGGQTAGDTSPHLARVLDEAAVTGEQRRAIQDAYKAGANPAAWQKMAAILTGEQLDRIGRRQPLASTVEHALVFAVEAQTLKRHPDAAERVKTMVEQINIRFAAGGIRRRFSVAGVRTYDKNEPTGVRQPANSGGKSLPADYETHPHDYILVAMDENAPGANWPCPWSSSVEIHGARGEGSGREKDMFVERSALVLAHELGHMLGLPDFYALGIEAKDNAVNHEAVPSDNYNQVRGTMMDDLGPFHPWDAEIINREIAALPVINHSWIDYQPRDCVLQVLGKDGLPLRQAEVKVYRSRRTNYYRQALDGPPLHQGRTDGEGKLSLGPNLLGVDPFQALCFFLVEIRQGERVDYRWFSFIEVNFSFWRGTPVTIQARL